MSSTATNGASPITAACNRNECARNQEQAMPDIFEVMSTMRSMRRLKPDPVPDELINKILQAGQWAPNGGNTQRWRFMVVKDPEVKRKVQVYYKRLYDETVGPRYANSP